MAGLKPFQPGRERPWDRRRARHLLERAGFGGSVADVDALVALGPREAVRRLLAEPEQEGAEPTPPFLDVDVDPGELRQMSPQQRREAIQRLQRQARQSTLALKGWWLRRMVTTPHPFAEKLALFWHGHFTSEARKVKSARLLYDQNQTFRRLGRGPFGELARAISRDPAMLIYLDNHQNVRGRPNENYARELLELFTLGIGHYTEADVEEAARAFTGWTVDRRRAARFGAPPFVVNERQHDDGAKTFLGQQGRFDGDDIVRVILQQPAAAEFLAGKLWAFFVSDEPPPAGDPAVAALAAELREHDYAVGPALERLFLSEAFYADGVLGSRIKSPVELMVGTLRRLKAQPDEQQARGLVFLLAGMGQDLFDPPNVAGWPGGREWISTGTLLARYNLSAVLLNGARLRAGARGGRRDREAAAPVPLELPHAAPEALVDWLGEHFLAVPLDAEQRQALLGRARALGQAPGQQAAYQLAHLVMSTPNYQVH